MSNKSSAPATADAAARAFPASAAGSARRTAPWLAALAPWVALVALTACGGGGGNDSGGALGSAPTTTAPSAPPETTAQVPPGAAASTQSFVSFAQGLAEDNMAEPLGMSSFLPPTDDTAEPMPIG